MGIFDGLMKKKQAASADTPVFPVMLAADAKGDYVPMEKIPDELFSQGVLGSCCGITPSEGKVYSPVDGRVSQIADTLHAVGIECAWGAEILIHVGVDTVGMNGDGFTAAVKNGERVKKGQLLLTMDLDKIKAAGYPDTVITVVTNSAEFSLVKPVASEKLEPGDDMLRIEK